MAVVTKRLAVMFKQGDTVKNLVADNAFQALLMVGLGHGPKYLFSGIYTVITPGTPRGFHKKTGWHVQVSWTDQHSLMSITCDTLRTDQHTWHNFHVGA